jgi:hypothetical protein
VLHARRAQGAKRIIRDAGRRIRLEQNADVGALDEVIKALLVLVYAVVEFVDRLFEEQNV